MPGCRRKLVRSSAASGEDERRLEVLAHLGRHDAGHARFEQAGRNSDGADAVTTEIARHGQRQGRNGALGSRVRDLAVLAVKGGAGGHHDDDAAVFLGRRRGILDDLGARLTDQIDSAAHVDVHDQVEVINIERATVSVDDLIRAVSTLIKRYLRGEGKMTHSGRQRNARCGNGAAYRLVALLGPRSGTLHGLFDAGRVEHVALPEFGRRADLGDEFLAHLLVLVEHSDVTAVGDDFEAAALAEARSAARIG